MYKIRECAECGAERKFKNTLVIHGRILCTRCYRSMNCMSAFAAAHKATPFYRKVLKPEEKDYLLTKYSNNGLKDQDKHNRLSSLRIQVNSVHKQVLADKRQEKPDFQKAFTELVQRRSR